MPVPTLNVPADGYSWVPCDDPTGNGLQSNELVHRDPDSGVITRSRFFEQIHNTSGLRFVDLGSADASGLFERDANGKIVIA